MSLPSSPLWKEVYSKSTAELFQSDLGVQEGKQEVPKVAPFVNKKKNKNKKKHPSKKKTQKTKKKKTKQKNKKKKQKKNNNNNTTRADNLI